MDEAEQQSVKSYPRLPYLLVSRGQRLESLSRKRLGELISERVRQFIGEAAGARVAAEPTPVHIYVIEPNLLEKMKGEGKVTGVSEKGELWHITDYQGRVHWKTETKMVLQPRTPAEWAFAVSRPPEPEEFYRVGPWVLRQTPQLNKNGQLDYYINVVGNAVEKREPGGGWFHRLTGEAALEPGYAPLWQHARAGLHDLSGYVAARLIRELLNGGEGAGVPASLACITVAIFLAEARRLSENLFASACLLDLASVENLPPEEINKKHPTAHGSGERDRETGEAQERVTDTGSAWFPKVVSPGTGLECVQSGYGAEPAGPTTERIIKNIIDQRLKSGAVGYEAQGLANHALSQEKLSGGGGGSGGEGGGTPEA